MILSALLFAWLLVGQVPEEGTAPQLNLTPNAKVLADVLNVPSARVSGIGSKLPTSENVKPPHIKYQPPPDYPEAIRKSGHTGTTIIRALLGMDGKIHNAKVVHSAGFQLDGKALEAVRNWVFYPATKDGRNVAAHVDITVDFKIMPRGWRP